MGKVIGAEGEILYDSTAAELASKTTLKEAMERLLGAARYPGPEIPRMTEAGFRQHQADILVVCAAVPKAGRK